MPKALVIRSAGTNCDAEMCRGFALAKAAVDLVHLDALIRDPSRLDSYDLFGFPGGFSYGDDIASGRIFAMKIRTGLYPALRAAIERGALMLGVCNGFQVMVQAGLLPGPEGAWPMVAPSQSLALTDNQDARFCDRWVPVAYEVGSACVWTRNLWDVEDSEAGADGGVLPVAHGEGRLVAIDRGVLASMERAGQIVLRYRDNYNGSEGAVAGVCDRTGRIFGLMPHPDRFLEWNRHPSWTRLSGKRRSSPTPGLRMFQNAVEAVSRVGVV
ncbi:MAG: phosphoribosylformylglycinamidine synthase [Phycisphaerae bacterium]|nr:MAG: phosphoribosylformylglycinamidine synthase [Phycisphaerae bacterium]